MTGDPGRTTWRVLWRSLVLAAAALFVAWQVAQPPPAPPTPPNDRAGAVPPVPVAKPGVR